MGLVRRGGGAVDHGGKIKAPPSAGAHMIGRLAGICWRPEAPPLAPSTEAPAFSTTIAPSPIRNFDAMCVKQFVLLQF
jgi:hypothetical protein